MSTKLYFHNAANALSGTFPTGEQSASTADTTFTGANTLRTMDTTIGVAQASLSGVTKADTATQKNFCGFFCSPALSGAQTVGGGSMVLLAAEAQAHLGADFRINNYVVYAWRPSTGAVVGYVKDAFGSGGTEPTAIDSEQTTYITGITSTGVSALDGDVVICEVWSQHGQPSANARNVTWYFDGTTEYTSENAATSSCASYIQLAETLTFAVGAFPFQKPYANFMHMLVR